MSFDTWLTEDDTLRLWAVVHGDLPESAATGDELVEFERVVLYSAMIKMAGPEYANATIQ
jgi:hypothetical protein